MRKEVKNNAKRTKITAERFGGFDIFATSFLYLLKTEISATAPAGGGAAISGFPCRQGAGSPMRYIYNIMYKKS